MALKEGRVLFNLEMILMADYGLFELKKGFERRAWPIRGGKGF